MKEIHGPDDVAVGDVIEHSDLDAFRATYTVCEVVRVGASRLTVRFPDGKTRACAYTKRRRRAFRKLDADDLWHRRRPALRTLRWSLGDVMGYPETMVHADTLAKAHADLDAIAAWMKERP